MIADFKKLLKVRKEEDDLKEERERLEELQKLENLGLENFDLNC